MQGGATFPLRPSFCGAAEGSQGLKQARCEVEIVNRRGLHARASAKLQKLAAAFSARVIVSHDGESADARSIMDLLMLAAGPGSRVTVEAEGEDAEGAVAAVVSLIVSGFGETN